MTSAALGDYNGEGPVCFSHSDVKALCLAAAVKRDFIRASQRAPVWRLPALFVHLADLTATGAPGSQVSLAGALVGKRDVADFQRLPTMEGGCVAISSCVKCSIKIRKLLKLPGLARGSHMVMQAEATSGKALQLAELPVSPTETPHHTEVGFLMMKLPLSGLTNPSPTLLRVIPINSLIH